MLNSTTREFKCSQGLKTRTGKFHVQVIGGDFQVTFGIWHRHLRISLIQTFFGSLPIILAFRAGEFGSLLGSSPVSHKWLRRPENPFSGHD